MFFSKKNKCEKCGRYHNRDCYMCQSCYDSWVSRVNENVKKYKEPIGTPEGYTYDEWDAIVRESLRGN